MQVFIWQEARKATWHYHDDAGVVIVALTLANARYLFEQWQKEHKCHNEHCSVYLVAPDRVLPTAPAEHTVYVFPDAGCC